MNNRTALLALITLSLALTACADMLPPAYVEGEIDRNEVPPLRDSFFSAFKVGDEFAILAMATTYDDACARQTDSYEDLVKAKRRLGAKVEEAVAAGAQEMFNDALEQYQADTEDALKDAFPEEHWEVSTFVRVEEEDDLDSESFEVEDTEDGVVGVRVCRQNAEPELNDEFIDENEDCFLSDNGDIIVDSYERSDVSIHAIVDLVEAADSDADAGNNVEVDLRAPRCTEIEDILRTYFENACIFAFTGSCEETPDSNGDVYCRPGTDTADCDD